MEFSAKQIAAFIQGEIIGDENATVHTFAKIEEGMPGAISFLSNPKYTPYIYETQSSVVLVNKDFTPEHEIKATLIKVDNAYESLAKLLNLYEMSKPKKEGIDSLAFVAPSAKIGENVYIGAFAYIGENAVIGDNTQIYPHTFVGDGVKIGKGCLLYSNVNVYHDCRIGNECILHSGAVIGADGFGFAPTPNGYDKIPQIGIVILEDKVDIGANTCVDRATMGATVIHSGAKIDNLVQIAHNDDFMGCTEAVKEVEERHAAFKSCQMSDSSQVHDFLYAGFSEHGKTGLTAGHDVALVTEDRHGIGSQGTGCDVEDARQEFPGNLVHIRNHEQQPLGSRIGRGQSTGSQGAVYGTGSAAFSLHFLNLDNLAEHVLDALGCPFIHFFCHSRARRDRINSGYISKHIGHIGGSRVAVHGHHFLTHY